MRDFRLWHFQENCVRDEARVTGAASTLHRLRPNTLLKPLMPGPASTSANQAMRNKDRADRVDGALTDEKNQLFLELGTIAHPLAQYDDTSAYLSNQSSSRLPPGCCSGYSRLSQVLRYRDTTCAIRWSYDGESQWIIACVHAGDVHARESAPEYAVECL